MGLKLFRRNKKPVSVSDSPTPSTSEESPTPSKKVIDDSPIPATVADDDRAVPTPTPSLHVDSTDKLYHVIPISDYLDLYGPQKIGLVVLNTIYDSDVVPKHHPLLTTLLFKSECRAAANGGANFFHDCCKHLSLGTRHPTIISGHVHDSIRPDVLAFYQSQKDITIDYTRHLHETAFSHVLRLLLKDIEDGTAPKLDAIVAFTNEAGRFDHLMGGINTLYQVQKLTNIPVVLTSGNDLQVVLGKPGRWELLVQPGAHCGLIPLDGSAKVTTEGLWWNLNNQVVQFGEMVSTSNEVVAERVVIETDKPLVWTMTVKGKHIPMSTYYGLYGHIVNEQQPAA